MERPKFELTLTLKDTFGMTPHNSHLKTFGFDPLLNTLPTKHLLYSSSNKYNDTLNTLMCYLVCIMFRATPENYSDIGDILRTSDVDKIIKLLIVMIYKDLWWILQRPTVIRKH